MLYTVTGSARSTLLQWFARGLERVLREHGYSYAEPGTPEIKLAINLADAHNPRPYRRKAQGTFVASVIEGEEIPQDVLKTTYPLLVRTLSNVLIYLVRAGDQVHTYFVTLEQGYYPVPFEEETKYFSHVYRRLAPLATSCLVINNEFHPDLEEELWEGDEITQQIYEAGKRLDALNLLPAPFPIHELLSPRDLRHVERLYGIGGLSYGNLSARKDRTRFWMSASGVNKANLRVVGQDILLVKGYDPQRNVILLSVPPNIKPRRVSVDAIEHWMIYTEHPQVGAIVHVHAWMEGVPSTEVNYPCGTLELAKAVAELVRRSDDPSRAVVGLRNHGLTITGPNLQDIFERIEGRIIRQVPMS